MEITWTYNWLETIGFLLLFFLAIFLVAKGVLIAWLWLTFRRR